MGPRKLACRIEVSHGDPREQEGDREEAQEEVHPLPGAHVQAHRRSRYLATMISRPRQKGSNQPLRRRPRK